MDKGKNMRDIVANKRIPRKTRYPGDHEYVKLKLAGSEAFISADVPLLSLQAFSAF